MANSGFSLTSFLGKLKRFLSSMTSPISGYEINDAKINASGSKYSILYEFGSGDTDNKTTDIKGEALTFTTLIQANTKEALQPIYSGLNELTTLVQEAIADPTSLSLPGVLGLLQQQPQQALNFPEGEAAPTSDDANADSNNQLLRVLLGSPDGIDPSVYYTIREGEGILGADLTTESGLSQSLMKSSEAMYAGKPWTWGYIASYISYSLECTAPNKDYGSIADQSLDNCGHLIGEYLEGQGLITSADELKLDVTKLIVPLLQRIQADLQQYYTDAYNKYIKKIPTAQQQAEVEQSEESADTEELTPEKTTSEANSKMSSKHINIKLQKIQGTTEFNLVGLQSNYNPTDTLFDLDDIINQSEFQNSVSTDLQTYSIDVDEDGYDVEIGESCEISPCDSLLDLLHTGISVYRNLYLLHWMSSGNDMMKLHTLCEDLYTELIGEIDTLGELLVEHCDSPNFDLGFSCKYLPTIKYDFQTGLSQIKALAQEYIDTIDYAYPNQTSDVQSVLDDWLRYWNKQLNYFLKQQTEG